MNDNKKYHISFFILTTETALRNRNMVLVLVTIWAVAIFGFHFLLRVVEKPTPEPVYNDFQAVWEKVKTNQASQAEMQLFAQTALKVSAKVFVKPEHRLALNNALSWAVFKIADEQQTMSITSAMKSYREALSKAATINDANYIAAKKVVSALVSPVIGINSTELIADMLPLELSVATETTNFTDSDKQIIETCVPLYTIHNQSFLTDFKFLGFPFHYFYSAVFLLTLFVGLCWYYCYLTDKRNKRLQIVE